MRTLLILAAFLAATPVAALAQPQRDTTISINMTRTGRAPADRASLYLGIEAVAETAPLAIERLEGKIKAILDSVRRASPTLQADAPTIMNVGPGAQNGYPQPSSPVVLARAALRITIVKLGELPKVQLAAASAGALLSTTPQYESTQLETVWNAKSAEALATARSAAEASADAQGYRLGRLLGMSINGGPQNSYQQQVQINFDPRNNYSPLFAPEITLSVTVNATYLLIKK